MLKNNYSETFFSLLLFILILALIQSVNGASVNPEIYFLNNFVLPYTIFTLFVFKKGILNAYTFEKHFILIYLCLIFVFTIVALLFQSTLIKINIVFWKSLGYATPLLAGFFFSRIINTKKQLLFAMNLIFAASIVAILSKVNNIGNLRGYLNLENILFGKGLILESDLFGFIFGFLTIIYCLYRKYFFMVIAVLFVILTGKRIVILGLLISMLVYYLMPKNIVVKYKILIIPINLFILLLVYLQATNDPIIEGYALQYFDLSVSALNSGRSKVYEPVIETLGPPTIIGFGVGTINSILDKSFYWEMQLFHSDILRIAYEFGILPFCLIIYQWFNSIKVDYKILPFLLLLNFYFISDNVIEYFPVMFIFYIIFFSYLKLNLDMRKNMKLMPKYHE